VEDVILLRLQTKPVLRVLNDSVIIIIKVTHQGTPGPGESCYLRLPYYVYMGRLESKLTQYDV